MKLVQQLLVMHNSDAFIKIILQQSLLDQNETDQAHLLIKLLHHLDWVEKVRLSAIYVVWQFLDEQQLWCHHRDSELNSLKHKLNFSNIIQSVLSQHQKLQWCKKFHEKQIQRQWEILSDQVLLTFSVSDISFFKHSFSSTVASFNSVTSSTSESLERKCLQLLTLLSKIYSLSWAHKLLEAVIEEWWTHKSEQSKMTQLLSQDVVKMQMLHNKQQLKQLSLFFFLLSSTVTAAPTTEEVDVDVKAKTAATLTQMHCNQETETEKEKESSQLSWKRQLRVMDSEDERDEDEDGAEITAKKASMFILRSSESKWCQIKTADEKKNSFKDLECCSEQEENGEMKNREEQEQKKEKVNGDEKSEKSKKGKEGKIEDEEEQESKKEKFKKMKKEEEDVLTTSSALCSCTFSIQSELTWLTKKLLKVLKTAYEHETRLNTTSFFCHCHLQQIINLFDLHNNEISYLLHNQLTVLHCDFTDNLNHYWAAHPSQVHQAFLLIRSKESDDEQSLMFYHFWPLLMQDQSFHFNTQQMFDHFLEVSSWKKFQQKGSINCTGVFSHFVSIKKCMQHSFALYHYYSSDAETAVKTRMLKNHRSGWVCMSFQHNMIYSLKQQLFWQDSVLYIITVMVCSDWNWWLIMHSDIVKTFQPSKKISFLHLNLVLSCFLEMSKEGSLMSCSIILNKKDAENCTVMIKSFHHHLWAWYGEVCQWGESKNKNQDFFNCSWTYQTQNWQQWSEVMLMLCSQYSICLIKPELIHSFSTKTEQSWHNFFVWHCSINNNYEDLDVSDSLTWSELMRCHQMLQILQWELQEQLIKSSSSSISTVKTFAEMMQLSETTSLVKTLTEEWHWDDSMMLQEWDWLLREDDEVVLQTAQQIHKTCLMQYHCDWAWLQQLEMTAYQQNFYFVVVTVINLQAEQSSQTDDKQIIK